MHNSKKPRRARLPGNPLRRIRCPLSSRWRHGHATVTAVALLLMACSDGETPPRTDAPNAPSTPFTADAPDTSNGLNTPIASTPATGNEALQPDPRLLETWQAVGAFRYWLCVTDDGRFYGYYFAGPGQLAATAVVLQSDGQSAAAVLKRVPVAREDGSMAMLDSVGKTSDVWSDLLFSTERFFTVNNRSRDLLQCVRRIYCE